MRKPKSLLRRSAAWRRKKLCRCLALRYFSYAAADLPRDEMIALCRQFIDQQPLTTEQTTS